MRPNDLPLAKDGSRLCSKNLDTYIYRRPNQIQSVRKIHIKLNVVEKGICRNFILLVVAIVYPMIYEVMMMMIIELG